MTSEVVYALAALVCYGLGDIIYKRAASAGLASDYFLMGQAWFFCPAVIVYAWITGTLEFSPAAIWGSVAGLVILIGFYNFSRSLQTGSVSVIAPVFRLNFIVTAALAIGWLDEPLTAQKLMGFLLAVVAGWLLLGGSLRRDSIAPAAARRSLLQVLIATTAVGTGNFCYKLGLIGGATPETMLVAQAVVFCSLVTVMTYARNGTIRPPDGFAIHSVSAAVVLVAAFLFLLHGLKHGEASVVVPIAQMGFVVAAVFGVVFFKEGWTARKVAGLCAATIALIVLAIG
ncbi:MAG: EamA family transporter [Alphaproteobacteria bacterium]|nr:EamA family transporter [Alphaproteobacteria bacterium]